MHRAPARVRCSTRIDVQRFQKAKARRSRRAFLLPRPWHPRCVPPRDLRLNPRAASTATGSSRPPKLSMVRSHARTSSRASIPLPLARPPSRQPHGPLHPAPAEVRSPAYGLQVRHWASLGSPHLLAPGHPPPPRCRRCRKRPGAALHRRSPSGPRAHAHRCPWGRPRAGCGAPRSNTASSSTRNTAFGSARLHHPEGSR